MARGVERAMSAPGDGIRCANCYQETGVVETRANVGSLRRRRRCKHCGWRVTTIEMPVPEHSKRDTTELVAVKRPDAARTETVPRDLMQALRALVQAHDVAAVAPEEHW